MYDTRICAYRVSSAIRVDEGPFSALEVRIRLRLRLPVCASKLKAAEQMRSWTQLREAQRNSLSLLQ